MIYSIKISNTQKARKTSSLSKDKAIIRQDLQMNKMLEQPDRKFKITSIYVTNIYITISMLDDPMEKMDNMHEHIWSFSKEMETIRIKGQQ